jgi:hypothetical protein
MEGNDGFPSSGRTGDTGGAVIVALHERALRRVKEDGPYFPRIIESAFKLLDVAHDAEAAFRVGMFEWVSASGEAQGSLGLFADGEIENGFGGFGGKVGGDCTDCVFAGGFDGFEPGGRDAKRQEFAIGSVSEGQGLTAGGFKIFWSGNLRGGFVEFNHLQSAGFGMNYELAGFSPAAGLILTLDD